MKTQQEINKLIKNNSIENDIKELIDLLDYNIKQFEKKKKIINKEFINESNKTFPNNEDLIKKTIDIKVCESNINTIFKIKENLYAILLKNVEKE